MFLCGSFLAVRDAITLYVCALCLRVVKFIKSSIKGLWLVTYLANQVGSRGCRIKVGLDRVLGLIRLPCSVFSRTQSHVECYSFTDRWLLHSIERNTHDSGVRTVRVVQHEHVRRFTEPQVRRRGLRRTVQRPTSELLRDVVRRASATNDVLAVVQSGNARREPRARQHGAVLARIVWRLSRSDGRAVGESKRCVDEPRRTTIARGSCESDDRRRRGIVAGRHSSAHCHQTTRRVHRTRSDDGRRRRSRSWFCRRSQSLCGLRHREHRAAFEAGVRQGQSPRESPGRRRSPTYGRSSDCAQANFTCAIVVRLHNDNATSCCSSWIRWVIYMQILGSIAQQRGWIWGAFKRL